MTFKWLRYDVECGTVSNIKPEMWIVADGEGEHVNAQAAIDREAVNAAVIATLEAQARNARIEMNRAYERHGEELALLRAQLAARDAALDAVLELAKAWRDCQFCDVSNQDGNELIELLLKHGVHAK